PPLTPPQAGQKIFTENTMPDVVAMVKANIVRALPKCSDDFDPEEDEPNLEPSWPHLQVVYEFFLRFVVSGEVNAKQAKKFVDQQLCMSVIDLFDSEDPRERDYLKTILHRIYGKFMTYRSYIRKAISNVFYGFDPDTAVEIIRGLIKFWPWLNSQKQVVMMNELEEILEFLGHEQLMVIRDELWNLFKWQIGSTHFQVSERVLFLWNNEHLVNSGCLSRQLADSLFPAIYPELKVKMDHWNPTVSKLAQSVDKMYQEFDGSNWEKVTSAEAVNTEEEEAAERAKNWSALEEMAVANRKK
ncbi:hypothetical protein TeGR_g7337, partial [Tetraparma gracilis]